MPFFPVFFCIIIIYLKYQMEVDVRENIGRLIKDLTETGEWVLDAQKLKVNSISAFAVYLHVNNMKWRKRT